MACEFRKRKNRWSIRSWIAINRAVDYYRKRGYSDKWIKDRLDGIVDRKGLTDVWKNSGITKDYEYGILTNEIYKEWSGMKASEMSKLRLLI